MNNEDRLIIATACIGLFVATTLVMIGQPTAAPPIAQAASANGCDNFTSYTQAGAWCRTKGYESGWFGCSLDPGVTCGKWTPLGGIQYDCFSLSEFKTDTPAVSGCNVAVVTRTSIDAFCQRQGFERGNGACTVDPGVNCFRKLPDGSDKWQCFNLTTFVNGM